MSFKFESHPARGVSCEFPASPGGGMPRKTLATHPHCITASTTNHGPPTHSPSAWSASACVSRPYPRSAFSPSCIIITRNPNLFQIKHRTVPATNPSAKLNMLFLFRQKHLQRIHQATKLTILRWRQFLKRIDTEARAGLHCTRHDRR